MASNTKDLITNLSQVFAQTAQQNQNTSTKQKKDTRYWINVGLERNGKLVSLPMGIPLDGLEARRIPSPKTQNQDFRNLRVAEAQLWDKVKEIFSTLKPGDEVTLPFTVKLRMTDDKEMVDEVDATDNPYAIGDLKAS